MVSVAPEAGSGSSIAPEIGVGLFAMYILYNVLDRHVLSKGKDSGGGQSAIHDREQAETLQIVRSCRDKLNEIVTIMRNRSNS